MENLIKFLLQMEQLNQQQIDLIASKVKIQKLKKSDFFSEAGKIPKQVAFIDEGIMRVCFFNKNGEEVTKYFVDEYNFVVDLNSFSSQIPSSEYIQAVTDCNLIIFSSEALKELSLTIINWDSMVNKITTKSLIEKVNRISPMLSEDATSRYLNFLEKFPLLVNRIPLSVLASYLGITQSSLSRIRRNI